MPLITQSIAYKIYSKNCRKHHVENNFYNVKRYNKCGKQWIYFLKNTCFLLLCCSYSNFSEIWDLGEYCKKRQIEFKAKGNFGRREVAPGVIPDDDTDDGPVLKRKKPDAPPLDADVIENNIAFLRSNYTKGKKEYFN